MIKRHEIRKLLLEQQEAGVQKSPRTHITLTDKDLEELDRKPGEVSISGPPAKGPSGTVLTNKDLDAIDSKPGTASVSGPPPKPSSSVVWTNDDLDAFAENECVPKQKKQNKKKKEKGIIFCRNVLKCFRKLF